MANRILLLTVLFFMLCPSHGTASQEYTANPLPFLSSLSSREITTLHQDREGFIWIGTTCGVARYDGFETVVFKSDYSSPERLTDNYITPMSDSEHRVFIGTKSGLNVFDKQTWRLHPADNGEFLHTEIKYVFTDSRQQVWIATARGLYRCNEQLDILGHYESCTGVTSVYEDHAGNVWILTWGKGLFRHDKKREQLVSYPAIGSQNIPFVLFQDKDERYWLGTWGDGLYRFHPETTPDKQFEPVETATGNTIFFDITQDEHTGHLWMLSYNMLCVFECTPNGTLVPVAGNTVPDRNRMFSKILKDREGNLWLGAYDDGYYLSFNPRSYQSHTLPSIKEQTGFDTNINCMYEDHDGTIWFNQERHGIALYDRQGNECNLTPCPDAPHTEVNFIVPSHRKNTAWMASSFIPIIFRAERRNMQIHFTDTLVLAADGGKTGHVIGIHEDRDGNVWAMTERTLFVYDRNKQPLHATPNRWGLVCCITETPDGVIWLGNKSGDLFRTKVSGKHIRTPMRYTCRKVINAHNAIRFMCSDRQGRIWIATTLGALYCFNPANGQVADHTGTCLQQASPVLNLFADGEDIFVITPSVAIRYNSNTHNRQVYPTENKHNPVHTYRNSASCLGKGHTFYAGGHGGFIMCTPHDTAGTPLKQTRVRLTDIRTEKGSILLEDSARTTVTPDLITIPSDVSRLELAFSACRFTETGQERPACRLEGFDSGWTLLDKGAHSVYYNRLPKGEYTLWLCMADETGRLLGEPASYKICKLPAWYETWFAYLLYIIIGVSLLIYMLRLYTATLRRRNARLLREELARTKLEYFTNVSHELLTPLTILSCLSDEMEQNEGADRHFVQVMRDNTARLKKLIKQVLDFRKIEKRNLPLKVRYGDAASFIRRISLTDFTLLAQKKKIEFRTQIRPNEIYGYYDADKLEEMLFNLLSNAIKYTPEGRAVGIDVSVAGDEPQKTLQIEVWDEGIGISAAEQSKIFTRFYRSPHKHADGIETNGIGLSLTQELVRLHHGSVSVQSQVHKGSRFRLSLPLSKEVYTPDEIAENNAAPSQEQPESATVGADRPSLLIVDDNHEITAAVERLLGRRYRITSAHSATQAETVVKEKDIDLIVCDFMMPGTSGTEFCRRIKSDLATSHIPVIILTARNTDEAQSACYEAGADGFIAKPFETKVLTARIDNLLYLYSRHRSQFLRSTEIDTKVLPYRDNDRIFLDEMVAAIESHLQDTDFKLDSLAGELRLSKSTMNRKIKAMTGLTPMDFVKNIRIKLACRLLLQPGMNISEVAYAVGFSDPKYFTKCFKEECGLTPTQYQQKHFPS